MFVTVLALATAPVLLAVNTTSPTTPAAVGKGATPANNPGTWVTTADYPPEAMRQEQEGMVGFQLSINTTGLVEECQITATSGAPVLDQATCTLIRQRARFNPARDATGAAVPGSYASRIRWQIPKNVPQPVAAEFDSSFVIAADGQITDCKIEKATGGATKMTSQPTPCQRQQKTVPFTDTNGKAVSKRVHIRQSLVIEPVQ